MQGAQVAARGPQRIARFAEPAHEGGGPTRLERVRWLEVRRVAGRIEETLEVGTPHRRVEHDAIGEYVPTRACARNDAEKRRGPCPAALREPRMVAEQHPGETDRPLGQQPWTRRIEAFETHDLRFDGSPWFVGIAEGHADTGVAHHPRIDKCGDVVEPGVEVGANAVRSDMRRTGEPGTPVVEHRPPIGRDREEFLIEATGHGEIEGVRKLPVGGRWTEPRRNDGKDPVRSGLDERIDRPEHFGISRERDERAGTSFVEQRAQYEGPKHGSQRVRVVDHAESQQLGPEDGDEPCRTTDVHPRERFE